MGTGGKANERVSKGTASEPIDRLQSPLQSLREAFSSDQVDRRALEQASATDFVARNDSKRAPKNDFARYCVDLGSPMGVDFTTVSLLFRAR